MTIALSLKVNEGVVLAADSASSMIRRDGDGRTMVANIYETANKVFNLHKELPLGAIVWGAGSIGPFSISHLAKDFRALISGNDPQWRLDPANYSVEEVVSKFHRFIYEMHYAVAFREWPEKPVLGFMIAGFSSGTGLAEEWILKYNGEGANKPAVIRQGECGVTWNGEPEAISRLLLGSSPGLWANLQQLGVVSADNVQQVAVACQAALAVQLVSDAMPIQDAIGLAEFLVDTTIKFSKYSPGPPTVGGPIEVAVITKHEGFKWVRRKHYFDAKLNPKEA